MIAAGGMTALLRLLAWMSPAFPVGAFSYSGGLERAVHDALLKDAAGLQEWIGILLRRGALWNDAVLLAEAWRSAGDEDLLGDVSALAQALAGSAERYRETVLLGEAFAAAASAWPHAIFETLPGSAPYPVAVGAIAAVHDIGLEDTLAAYLHSGVSQLISAGIRLGLAGQRDGVAMIAALEALIAELAAKAACSTLDDLGSATIMADMASLRHETQTTRLFRS
jgi:urease accessory protein